MSPAVRQLLDSFNALSPAEQHQLTIEILRRNSTSDYGDVPDAALIEAADELFRALDAEEARHAAG
jgi:hypothetical protein